MNNLPCSIGFAILTVSAGLAQSTGDRPRFEVASVKPSAPGGGIGSMNGGPMSPGPFNMADHDPEITWTKGPLETLVIDHAEKVPTEN